MSATKKNVYHLLNPSAGEPILTIDQVTISVSIISEQCMRLSVRKVVTLLILTPMLVTSTGQRSNASTWQYWLHCRHKREAEPEARKGKSYPSGQHGYGYSAYGPYGLVPPPHGLRLKLGYGHYPTPGEPSPLSAKRRMLHYNRIRVWLCLLLNHPLQYWELFDVITVIGLMQFQ